MQILAGLSAWKACQLKVDENDTTSFERDLKALWEGTVSTVVFIFIVSHSQEGISLSLPNNFLPQSLQIARLRIFSFVFM